MFEFILHLCKSAWQITKMLNRINVLEITQDFLIFVESEIDSSEQNQQQNDITDGLYFP